MRHTLVILAVFVCGCSSKTVEPDTRPAFVLDASKPFVIEFGRGSGWQGLDVVRIDQTGAVQLHRITRDANVETASLRLSNADTVKVAALVNSWQLTSMGRTYSDPAIADGTQWVLWIQQASSEKSIYFNNSFPLQITAFAGSLDAILQNAGLDKASWTLVPRQQGIDQQAALWARIEQKK